MKVLYSQIKELVPELKASPKEVGEALTMAGLMLAGIEKVSFLSKPDFLIDLEVRQNRPDCLGVIGVSREVAAIYGLKVKLPEIKINYPKKGEVVDIKVEAKNSVKRLIANEISGLKNRPSPKWLKDFLGFYGINNVNLLVDLSNYVMMLTGYPCHLLDKEKIIGGRLYWSLNNSFGSITTLDGTIVKMPKKEELLIKDEKRPLGLAGIVGGQLAAIGPKTTEIIAEMAVYDQGLIRRNARDLNISTEAGNRLSKDLDPNGIGWAMSVLVNLILKEAGGKLVKKPFNYYPAKRAPKPIEFDPAVVSSFSGIDIPEKAIVEILKNLRFRLTKKANSYLVVPPSDRTDINIEEDIVEEAIRLFGYSKIPAGQPLAVKPVERITPKRIFLADLLKDSLVVLGFDEILSLPLTNEETNKKTNCRSWNSIRTQNSVNEEFPDLRQSLAGGLISQRNEYLKKNLRSVRIFEVGAVFGKEKDRYLESFNLGILLCGPAKKSVKEMKTAVETCLRLIGFEEISYQPAVFKPLIANPYSLWEIMVDGVLAGVLYKLKPEPKMPATVFSEISILTLESALSREKSLPAVELNQKLVILDANVELPSREKIGLYLKEIERKVGKSRIWDIMVADAYGLDDKIKYTVRVAYVGLSDVKAKEIHFKVFNLKQK